MKFVYSGRQNDDQIIKDYIDYFNSLTDEEIIEKYNRQVRCGITGVHQQALYLIALRHVIKERFGDSPVHFDDGIVLGLSGKAALKDGKLITGKE